MCGFFGFVDFDGHVSPTDHKEVRRGAEAIRYRGPDDFGFAAGDEHCIAFCRLGIIDLTAPSQPFSNQAGTVTMVCNGEIYNFLALRDELEAKGYVFRTNTDSEVVLHGYDLDLVRLVSDSIKVPVIAMGGVGSWQHLVDGITEGHADAVAAGNIFHYTEHSTKKAKEYLLDTGLDVRKPVFYKVGMPRLPKYRPF